jgi:hypothetical protein
MSSTSLKRFTAFAWGHDVVAPEVWVNPAHIAYVAPRVVTRGHAECFEGSLLYFQQEAGVLAVRESIGLVVSTLQSGRGGVCKDCYQPLRESWMSVCDDCREQRHRGIDEDYEAAYADVGPHKYATEHQVDAARQHS